MQLPGSLTMSCWLMGKNEVMIIVNLKIYLQIASWTLKFRHEYASDIYKAIRRRTNASL